MGEHRRQSVEERAAEIASQIVCAAMGENGIPIHHNEEGYAQKAGVSVRTFYQEIYGGVLASLKGQGNSPKHRQP